MPAMSASFKERKNNCMVWNIYDLLSPGSMQTKKEKQENNA